MSNEEESLDDPQDPNEFTDVRDPRMAEAISSQIDFQVKTTNPQYGKSITPEIDNMLSKDEDLKQRWQNLGLIYTRDKRLGNTTEKQNTFLIPYDVFSDDLIGDDLFPAALTANAHSRAIGENSQQLKGFVRKTHRTKISRQEFSDDNKGKNWGNPQ